MPAAVDAYADRIQRKPYGRPGLFYLKIDLLNQWEGQKDLLCQLMDDAFDELKGMGFYECFDKMADLSVMCGILQLVGPSGFADIRIQDAGMINLCPWTFLYGKPP